MYCNLCGFENPDGSLFCSRCGAKMEVQRESDGSTVGLPPVESELEEEVEIAPPTETLKRGMGLMVIKNGPDAGMTFTLDRDLVTIGRHPESDIFLDDITVSRRHAEISRDRSVFTLKDTGSLNGTYLNRERIESAVLENGDEIQIGKYRLLFFSAPD